MIRSLTRIRRIIPPLVLVVGFTLHFIGLFRIPAEFVTLWAIRVHLSMLGLDGAALYGLMR